MYFRVQINRLERGLVFEDRDFVRVLPPGAHAVWGFRTRVDVLSLRSPLLTHGDIELLRQCNALDGIAQFVTVRDDERGLLYDDNRFVSVLSPGTYAVRQVPTGARVDIVTIEDVPLFRHPRALAIAQSSSLLDACIVEAHQVGVLFSDGRVVELLPPGSYALWKSASKARIACVDVREQLMEISGQEILTADRVSIRVNAHVAWKYADVLKALATSTNPASALYSAAQFGLRSAIGTRDLDALLADKEQVSAELLGALRPRAAELGLEVASFGIRDLILPGDMRELLNKVVAAKKEAEASLITRREETAELRHQANSARLFEASPVLLRLREIEAAERIAAKASITIVGNGESAVQQLVKLV